MMGPRVPGKSNSIPFSLPTDHAEGSARQMVEQVRARRRRRVPLSCCRTARLGPACRLLQPPPPLLLTPARAQHHLSLYKQIQGATAQLDNQEPKVRARLRLRPKDPAVL